MPKHNADNKSNADAKAFKLRLDMLLASGRIADAIRFLDRYSDNRQLSLFESKSELEARRQLAWRYKINLLRSIGRSKEALAWACLEAELNPDNVDAHATKEQLKKRLGLGPDRSPVVSLPSGDDRWTGVAGMRELKAILERDVILPLEQPELYKQYRVSLPNGILLYGPPGCGKTFIAQKLGAILGFHFIEIKPSDLGSIYVHGTQEKIGDLFKDAREEAPCLLFFDELDALLPNRGGEVGHHYSAEVNEFLTHLNKASERNILVVGATNRLESIDSAALRPGRFDKKVFVGQPDLEARTQLLKLYMASRPQEKIDWVKMAKESDGYTCAELEHVVNEAARRALERRRNIDENDLLTALAQNAPSHPDEKSENV